MRVLFLSDTHLGHDLPKRAREARARGGTFFESFDAALAPARSGHVDVVLHGGDLLYRSRVPAWLSDAALGPLRQLADGGIPVLLLPGNHERGRVSHPLLARHPNVHVFDRPRTVVLASGGVRVAFIGFPYARDVRARFGALLAEACAGAPGADVRLLCLHHCVEGATCGPGDFTFRGGPDVIPRTELPRDVAAVLCGHIHRHQVLRADGVPPVIYAGSTARTSRAEAGEVKGVVLVRLDEDGLVRHEFRPLPDRSPLPRSGRSGSRTDCAPPGSQRRSAAVRCSSMCGRFTLTARDLDEAARAFGAEVAREHAARYRPRWNVAPTDGHWVVLLDPAGKRRMVPARFGFERADGRLVVNARSETVAALPTFRKAFAEGRCLVPADGFYEWQGGRSDRRPLWFHDRGGKPFAFAGLAEGRAESLAFVILTTAANERMRPVHDRMPVVLSPAGADAWLTRGDASLLVPAPESWLVAREVSPRVNAVANDGPELLEAPAPERQLRLL